MINKQQHWRIDIDDEQVMWLWFDRKNANTNTISLAVLHELEDIIKSLDDEKKISALIIASAKDSGFIAGADVEQFQQLDGIDDVNRLIQTGQDIFNRIAALKLPTIAMVHGFCMGGGMELALACDYCVAEDSDTTRFALPEVKLGIQPGWGGTIRLPKKIGAWQALPLMMSGKSLRAKQAYRMGLIDAIAPKRQLRKAALSCIGKRENRKNLLPRIQEAWPMRFVIAKIMRWQLSKKIQQDHYPAPYEILNNWEIYGVSHRNAFAAEAESVAKLFLNYTTKNLVGIFNLQNFLKDIGKKTTNKVQHVHVIGAGVMGSDIATWCASQGLFVTLQDRAEKYIAPAIKHAHNTLKRIHRDPYQQRQALDRLIPDVTGLGIATADVIIEAIIEDLSIKQALFIAIEQQAKANAILASNTSSIPLTEISQAMQAPERLVGIHFFNPVARMPLVEIIVDQHTDQMAQQQAFAFVLQIKKLPLPVKSSPGFLINRILSPYLMESVAILDEGVPATLIDRAAIDFGMPMGPIALADNIGLDICLLVSNNLTKHYGGSAPRHLQAMVKKGYLGRKTGQGFYHYSHGKITKEKIKKQDLNKYSVNDITERLMLRMLNEVVACLGEKVVDNAQLLDAGMIFGTGFAPFRGGPVQYICSRGIPQLIGKLKRLSKKHGERFEPHEHWYQLEKEG